MKYHLISYLITSHNIVFIGLLPAAVQFPPADGCAVDKNMQTFTVSWLAHEICPDGKIP